MHILLALAHRRPDSFNSAVRTTLAEILGNEGHSVDVADLYAESFNPVMGGGLQALGIALVTPNLQMHQQIVRARGPERLPAQAAGRAPVGQSGRG